MRVMLRLRLAGVVDGHDGVFGACQFSDRCCRRRAFLVKLHPSVGLPMLLVVPSSFHVFNRASLELKFLALRHQDHLMI